MERMFLKNKLLLFLVLVSFSFATVPAGGTGTAGGEVSKVICRAGPETSMKIVLTSIATVYNVFPISIGPMKFSFFKDLEDLDLSMAPICFCGKPIPRIGIKIGLWEPIAIMEPARIPWCTPTLPIPGGLTGKIPFNAFAIGQVSSNDEDNSKLRTLQMHYYRYLPWALLELFMDFVCLETRNPFDIAYLTELDPLWQNDMLATILGPEAVLFANPIAQMACAIDAIASTVGFPLDPLFWCMGAWGSMYPMSESIPIDDVQSAAGLITRMLYKLHRELILWGSFGKAGLCGRYPMPIMRKRQYSIFPIYPIVHPKRFPIGRHSFVLWGWGQNVPVLNQYNQAWMIYRKRDCCAF